jgi:hypothetical protein
MVDIINFSKRTIEYLENDLESYEAVLNDNNLNGKLGFGMVATAMAAFETYAYILKGGNSNYGTGGRFKYLIDNCRDFYPDTQLPREDVVYNVIRNGVIHQLYPKNIAISANLTGSDLFQWYKNCLSVNSYVLYREVLYVIKGIHEHMLNGTKENKSEWSKRLKDRRKDDQGIYMKNRISTSVKTETTSLPTSATTPPPEWIQ